MKSLATAVFLLFLAAPCAYAQSWPAKPVRLILSQPPGSSPDIVARLIADRLAKTWSQAAMKCAPCPASI